MISPRRGGTAIRLQRCRFGAWSIPGYGAGEFIYLKGVASTVVGSVATYNADDLSTTLLVANAIGPAAVAMSANVASQYGWYQISGKAVVKAETVADNGNIYGTATPGQGRRCRGRRRHGASGEVRLG